jgi:hypothetical protein
LGTIPADLKVCSTPFHPTIWHLRAHFWSFFEPFAGAFSVIFCLTLRRTNGKVKNPLQSGKSSLSMVFEKKKLLATSL